MLAILAVFICLPLLSITVMPLYSGEYKGITVIQEGLD